MSLGWGLEERKRPYLVVEKDPAKEARNVAGVMKKPSRKQKTVENPVWTSAMFAEARKASEVLPKLFGPKTAAVMLKPKGRPKSPHSKVAISLRLPPETLARWKATGPGWQTRMSEVLRSAV